MLKMSQIDYIKYLRESEGCSISEIASRLEIDWRTAKKYADENVKVQNQGKQKREKPVMGPYLNLLEAWIKEDLRMPKKQRRTAKAYYNQLKGNTNFDGSSRLVRHYTRKIKNKLKNAQKEQYVRLEHQPATAQVDFGEFQAVDPKKKATVKYFYLVMSFPYSNAQLCRVLPAQNTECFLKGLQSMFEEIGGVPRVIWFDNLSPAVSKVLKGDKRKLTKAFKEFKWHYRFEAKFCNPGKGNEKGHVENKIGYIRRNWFSPKPIIRDLDEFNKYLKKEMIKDRKRKHSSKKELISTLWEKDQNTLLVLPSQPKEIYRMETASINKYGEFKIKNNYYHLPETYYKQKVLLKLYPDKIIVLDQYGEKKIASLPRKYNLKVEDIDWQKELEIFKYKPKAIEHAVHLKALPEVIKNYLLSSEMTIRKKRIKILLSLLTDFSITEIKQVIIKAKQKNRMKVTYLKALLENQKKQSQDGSWKPESVADWRPPLSEYNQLCREVTSL